MKRIAVTGATGFLAGHLIPEIENSGRWEVIGAARSPVKPIWLDSVQYFSVDFCSYQDTSAFIRKLLPDAIVHLAGRAQGTPGELFQTNVVTTSNILSATNKIKGDCRLILMGSAAEYGAPSNDKQPISEDVACVPESFYGISKLASTALAIEAARTWHARVTVLRPFNIVGENMPPSLVGGALLHRLFEFATGIENRPIRVGRIDTERDFVAVDDVVRAIVRMLKQVEYGEIYNLCSGRPTSISELLEILRDVSGIDFSWTVDPLLVRDEDVQTSYGCNAKATRALGFEPKTSLADSLRRAWNAKIRPTPA